MKLWLNTNWFSSQAPPFFLDFSYTLSWKLCLGLCVLKKFQSLFLVVCVMGYQGCSRLHQFSCSWGKMSYLLKNKKREQLKESKHNHNHKSASVWWNLSVPAQRTVETIISQLNRCDKSLMIRDQTSKQSSTHPHEQHLLNHEGAARDISNRGHGSGVTTCRRSISMSGMLVNQLHFAVSRLWV